MSLWDGDTLPVDDVPMAGLPPNDNEADFEDLVSAAKAKPGTGGWSELGMNDCSGGAGDKAK